MGFRIGKAILSGVAMALLLLAPAAAQVPDPYARDLAHKLTEAETVLGQGYYRVAGPFPGEVAQGGAVRTQLTLRAGQDYRIVGVCDVRCGDLDLRLLDPDDELVAQDARPGPVPVITARVPFTGPHTIEVIMARCNADPCYFAFNVYAR